MGRIPAMMFYNHDWLSDPALRSVSLAARGLWMDMLCVLWDSKERGISPFPAGKAEAKAWAKVVGHRADYVRKVVASLDLAKVFSRREGDHRIYSRRMVREELERKRNRESHQRNSTEFPRLFPDFPFHSSSSISSSNLRTPLPPASGGVEIAKMTHDQMLRDEKNYAFLPWGSGHIVIRTGRFRRVFTQSQMESMTGLSIDAAVQRIRGKGFWAEVYQPTEKADQVETKCDRCGSIKYVKRQGVTKEYLCDECALAGTGGEK